MSRGLAYLSQIYLDFLSSRGRCSIAGHSGNDFGISREDVPLYILGIPASNATVSRYSEFLRDHLRALHGVAKFAGGDIGVDLISRYFIFMIDSLYVQASFEFDVILLAFVR
ncbi:hypothetical protein BJ912DRAFT_1049137 [Pholiota molesta]|nr:hypothetical protein BJ912DRAFT_1049137 [Pholiota molesta]